MTQTTPLTTGARVLPFARPPTTADTSTPPSPDTEPDPAARREIAVAFAALVVADLTRHPEE